MSCKLYTFCCPISSRYIRSVILFCVSAIGFKIGCHKIVVNLSHCKIKWRLFHTLWTSERRDGWACCRKARRFRVEVICISVIVGFLYASNGYTEYQEHGAKFRIGIVALSFTESFFRFQSIANGVCNTASTLLQELVEWMCPEEFLRLLVTTNLA